MKGIVVAACLLIGSVFVGLWIGEATYEPPVYAPQMPEMTQVPEVTEAPEETQPIEVPEETQVSELTAREKAYLDEVLSHWATMNECQKRIAQVDDSNMKSTYAAAAVTMRYVMDSVWGMTPPASLKELHNAFEGAVGNFSGGCDALHMWRDTGDQEYYGLAMAYAARTDEWIDEVHRLLDELDR